MKLTSLAWQAVVYWLLFPALALPVALAARRLGHRDFLKRALVWFAIIPVFLGCAYLGPWPFFVLLLASSVAACVELGRLDAARAEDCAGRALFAILCALPWLVWAQLDPRLPSAILLVAVVVPAGLYFSICGRARAWFPLGLLSMSLGGALSFWLLVSGSGGFGPILFGFSVVVMNDIMAFFSGKFLAGIRPFPERSPQKTVAGYAGGFISAVLVGVIFGFAVPRLGPPRAATAGALLALSGSAGDLLASALKRRHGVKDFGAMLGPLGGVLDRLDSLLGAGPMLYLYLRLVP